MTEPDANIHHILETMYDKGYQDGVEAATVETDQALRLEAIKLAVTVKAPLAKGDTRAVIRSAHGIYDFIKTGNRPANATETEVGLSE